MRFCHCPLIVATEPDNTKTYYGSFKIISGVTWSSELGNQNSIAYQTLAAELTASVSFLGCWCCAEDLCGCLSCNSVKYSDCFSSTQCTTTQQASALWTTSTFRKCKKTKTPVCEILKLLRRDLFWCVGTEAADVDVLLTALEVWIRTMTCCSLMTWATVTQTWRTPCSSRSLAAPTWEIMCWTQVPLMCLVRKTKQKKVYFPVNNGSRLHLRGNIEKLITFLLFRVFRFQMEMVHDSWHRVRGHFCDRSHHSHHCIVLLLLHERKQAQQRQILQSTVNVLKIIFSSFLRSWQQQSKQKIMTFQLLSWRWNKLQRQRESEATRDTTSFRQRIPPPTSSAAIAAHTSTASQRNLRKPTLQTTTSTGHLRQSAIRQQSCKHFANRCISQ